MKADPADQLALLDVQALDARADQLRHQAASLSEHQALEAAGAQRRQVDDALRDARIVADDLAAEQAKVDADVEQVKTRRARDRDRLDQGLVGNPKDLERLQHELESLQRRITTLEDQELEIMEQVEEAQGQVDALAAELAKIDARTDELTASRDASLAELKAELAQVQGQREPLAGALPADLLALYDRLRESKAGVGAAALRARECGGCRLTLDHAELATIKAAAPDEVLRCEECQRILVRTSESGL